MLFDLRSRRRRTTVRIVYVLLAFIMLAGLVLVGVGTGNNNGGLLNAFTNNGTGNGGNQVNNQAVKAALRKAQKDPSAKTWFSLMEAYYSDAESGSNYNSTTGTFSKAGKVQLRNALVAWDKYLKAGSLKSTLEDAAVLAAKTNQSLSQWKDASVAWQYMIQSQDGAASAVKGYECVALNLYASGYTSSGDLASAKALTLLPKIDKVTWKSDAKAAKGSKTTAAEYVQSLC